MIKILTEPIIAILLISGIVAILLLGYKYILKPNEKFFLFNELILLVTGIIGLLGIISNNKELRNEFEIKKIEFRISSNYRFTKEHLDENYYCFKYVKSDLFTKVELNQKQKIRDETCEWIKKSKEILEKTEINDFKKIEERPSISENIRNEFPDIIQYESEIDEINNLIDERTEKIKETRGINILKNINDTIGIFFLLLSFSIKLSELIYRLNKKKT